MLARQATTLAALPTLCADLTPFPRYSCGLFGHAKKLNSFAINQIHTLSTKHPEYGVPLRHLRALRVSLPRASKGALSLLVDFLTLRFHNLTNPFSSNPFPFTSIQNPRGVGGCEPPLSPGDRNRKLGQTPNSTKICFPFNAVYRHSMHRNTVQRKVWSHKANSGRLDAETFGGSAQLFHLRVHLRPAGGTF
jgi:hypothetical protein